MSAAEALRHALLSSFVLSTVKGIKQTPAVTLAEALMAAFRTSVGMLKCGTLRARASSSKKYIPVPGTLRTMVGTIM
jgi:hypothetical protein